MLEPGDVDAFEASIKKADFLLLNNEGPEAVNLRAVDLAQRRRRSSSTRRTVR